MSPWLAVMGRMNRKNLLPMKFACLYVKIPDRGNADKVTGITSLMTRVINRVMVVITAPADNFETGAYVMIGS